MLFGLVLLLVDGAVYLFLGIALMSIDDDAAFSEEWVFSEMNNTQQLAFASFTVWNFVNLAAVVILMCWLYSYLKNKNKS